ncbi:MAG: hypothetical protein HKO66_05430 [Saprospiraceae bacterium]|nr:hypothetical protein [Bacteroidia bacterium]NNL91650.1 hypothetical protein [Saprospiraceae bacterium]
MRLLLTLFTFISVFLCNQMLFAQTEPFCGSTMQAHEQLMEENEEYRQRFKKWQKLIKPIIKARNENKNPDCTNGPLLVPVAIHFDAGIVPAGQEQCAIDVAIDHIQELNLEFAGLDVDAPLINQFTACFGANILGNACLEFCIGTVNHPPGYGLVDGDYAVTFNQVSFTIPSGNFTPVNSDWDEYVNIYVDNLPGGLLGVSNGIPGNFNGDGVLLDNCVFGTGAISCPGAQFTGATGCFAAVDEGEVLAHELGHYFGLFHIWGDNSGCSGAQDQIADTPDMASSYSSYLACGSHITCSDLPQTCGTEDMYMNFMSYAGNACMYMFTSNQSDVMNATAVTEGYTTTTTKCGTPPLADFTPFGAYELCNTDCIDYTDQSLNNPLDWDWSFVVTSGDIVLDITTSILQNPTVCLTAGVSGVIETTLTVSNSIGTTMKTQTLDVSYGIVRTTYADVDNDTYGDPNDVTIDCDFPPPGNVLNNLDCDDTDPNINPAAVEVCDGIDNNCDGTIDEGFALNTYYADADMDSFGDNNATIMACVAPPGYVTDNTDCDDTDADIFPGATEICDDIDNNCDGNTDEGLPLFTYYEDADSDTYGNPAVTIQDCSQPAGYVSDDMDCDDTDPNINPSTSELCDGVDNNCDGTIDEGCVLEDCDGDSLIINTITQNTNRAEFNVTSEALVNNGQSILFTAGTDINLDPSFEVVQGTIFEASIIPCMSAGFDNDEEIISRNLSDFEKLSEEVYTLFDVQDIVTLIIINKDGKIYYQNQTDLNALGKVIDDETKKLKEGFYVINILAGKKSMSQRIVITN